MRSDARNVGRCSAASIMDEEIKAEIVEHPRLTPPLPWIACTEIGLGFILWGLLMQGDIARLWLKIKQKRDAERKTAQDDIASLRAQIQNDALNDDDRAAIEEIKREAGE